MARDLPGDPGPDTDCSRKGDCPCSVACTALPLNLPSVLYASLP